MVMKNRETLVQLELNEPEGGKDAKKGWQRKISAYETRILDYDQELLKLALDDDKFHSIALRKNYIETLGKERKISENKFQRIKKDIAKSIDYDEPIEVQRFCIEAIFVRNTGGKGAKGGRCGMVPAKAQRCCASSQTIDSATIQSRLEEAD